MNREQYAQWRADAARALSGRYKPEEIEIVLDWFDGIKGQEERDLIGSDEVDAMLVFVSARGAHDLYNSLMARVFVYAPFILKEDAERVANGWPR